MNIENMTQKDFRAIPAHGDWRVIIEDFDSVVLLPERTKHDSGFRCISYVLCKKGEPITRLGSCSDVLNIDGIGGYGPYDQRDGCGPVPAKGWCIDCLPESGLFRLFCDWELRAAERVSDQSIYGIEKK